jgi:hypothetical protein
MRIQLGMKVRDVVTGFEGIVTGYHSWMTGCDSVTVQPVVDKDGKTPDGKGFDVIRLKIINATPVKMLKEQPIPAARDNGGPHDEPTAPQTQP